MVKLIWKKQAQSVFAKLDAPIQRRITHKLREIVENAQGYPHRPLKRNFAGSFKLRIGIYRIIYTYQKNTLIVRSVQRRDKGYK